MMSALVNRLFAALLLAGIAAGAPKDGVELWSQKPVVRPAVPAHATQSKNPIDAFIAAELAKRGLQPAGPADKATLLRRVYLDLIGLPPHPAEQDAFLNDESPRRLREGGRPPAGQRAARRPLRPALARRAALRRRRRADVRRARHSSLARLGDPRTQQRHALRPVRARATYRLPQRAHADVATSASARGSNRGRTTCSRWASWRAAASSATTRTPASCRIVAVETVSTAFMGLTVGCAKCHDHMYDPISQKDFYAMKALFDPLVVKKVTLAIARRHVRQRPTRRGRARKRERR